MEATKKFQKLIDEFGTETMIDVCISFIKSHYTVIANSHTVRCQIVDHGQQFGISGTSSDAKVKTTVLTLASCSIQNTNKEKICDDTLKLKMYCKEENICFNCFYNDPELIVKLTNNECSECCEKIE